jgi:hypothetical protein
MSFGDAVQLVEKIYNEGGGQASYDLMSQLTGNSTSSSSFNRRISALRIYGLVTDVNRTVSLTDLGMSIAAPKGMEGAQSSRKEALLRVDLFSKIYERHKGKLLPADEFLKNILEQDFSVPKDFSSSWVDAFKEGARSANLLFDRGDGKIQLLESPTVRIKNGTVPLESPPLPEAPPTLSNMPGMVNTSVPFSVSGHNSKIMLSSGRIAEFAIPDNLTPRDATKLKLALDGLKTMIESLVVEQEIDSGIADSRGGKT